MKAELEYKSSCRENLLRSMEYFLSKVKVKFCPTTGNWELVPEGSVVNLSQKRERVEPNRSISEN